MTEPSGDTRERIRAVALELFTQQGFEKTNLRQIAERLDVTKAALYYHFRSKAELIASLVSPLMEDMDALLDKASATPPGPRTLFSETFDTVARHQTVFMALTRDASAFAHVDLEQRANRWIEEIQAALVGDSTDTDRRVRAVVAFTGITRAATFPGFSNLTIEQIRTPAIDAACAALGEP